MSARSNPASFKKKLITMVVVVGIMLLEGAGILVAVKISGGTPTQAEAGGLEQDPTRLIEEMDSELALVDCDAINRKSGQPIVVHVSVSVRVAPQHQEHAARLIEKRQNTLKDRIQMILRRADPQHLNEPNLDTIKRQIEYEAEKILGDEDLIAEVLIPQMLQSRSRL